MSAHHSEDVFITTRNKILIRSGRNCSKTATKNNFWIIKHQATKAKIKRKALRRFQLEKQNSKYRQKEARKLYQSKLCHESCNLLRVAGKAHVFEIQEKLHALELDSITKCILFQDGLEVSVFHVMIGRHLKESRGVQSSLLFNP